MFGVGKKRKWRRFQVMSALPHKADIDARDCDVRFVPTTEVAQLIQSLGQLGQAASQGFRYQALWRS
jgi:hypothetical protein